MNVVLQTQKAIYNVLKGDAALGALIENVYDFVPVGAAYPYVTIGEATLKDGSSLGLSGYQLSLMVNVYSQAMGQSEILGIIERIYELIARQDLTVTGYDFICASFTEMSSERLTNGDFDGKISFNILLKDGGYGNGA